MVRRVEHRVLGVGAVQKAGGVGHPGDEADVVVPGDGEEPDRRVLLHDAVDDLERGDAALLHRSLALLEPADVGAQGYPIVAYLPLFDQVVQRVEDLVVLDGADARVVELVQVDVVGLQPDEALLTSVADEFGRVVLRALRVSLPGGVRVEVVAELGGDHDVVALLPQRLGQDSLSVPDAVGVSRVEEVDAEVVSLLQEVDALVLVYLPPPVGAHSPEAEAYLRDLELRGAKSPILQWLLVLNFRR